MTRIFSIRIDHFTLDWVPFVEFLVITCSRNALLQKDQVYSLVHINESKVHHKTEVTFF